MYNHRIVPSNAAYFYTRVPNGDMELATYEKALIPCPSEWTAEQAVEILKLTAEEWNLIFDGYIHYRCAEAEAMSNRPFSWFAILTELERKPLVLPMDFDGYLYVLISLTPLKGLTVEEIKKLNEVKQ